MFYFSRKSNIARMDDVTEEVGPLFVAFNEEYADRYFDPADILKKFDGGSNSYHEVSPIPQLFDC